MLKMTSPKPSAAGARIAAQTGAVIISQTVAVGRISRTRCAVNRRVPGWRVSVNSFHANRLQTGLGDVPPAGLADCGGGRSATLLHSRELPGSSSARQSTTFGTWGPEVQILSPRLAQSSW